ncbi:MAG: major capsid protein [Microvirus sp.]|nr:MAG: major capsid protein [Microvirus sp.]
MKRSKFNLSFTRLMSGLMGECIPIGVVEALPGDSVQMHTTALIRLAPMLAPVMHPTQVRIHHWFVPHRLTWSSWETFITGGPDGLNASVFPTISVVANAVGTVADYLGIPEAFSGAVSALPFRAYQLIWNEWYRDQDLQTAAVISKADGADTTTSTSVQNCCWEKDYFTTLRPWEAKGPNVQIPLSGSALVTPNEGAAIRTFERSAPGAGTAVNVVEAGGAAGTDFHFKAFMGSPGQGDTPPSVSIGGLRQGLAVQRFEEARARYGSRYTEYLQNQFGVRSADARLQRPEYLGGGRQTIQISEVLQTAEGVNTDVGELRGHGIAAMQSNRFRRFIEEHGYIITIMSIRPKSIYQEGLERHWNKRTKYDFYQRELAHIGQQIVPNKEVFSRSVSPDATFGYGDRYAEYRYKPSTVSGEFRTLLDFWHMSRKFASAPALNSTFVSCVPTLRDFAVASQDVVYVQARHSLGMRRCVTGNTLSFAF